MASLNERHYRDRQGEVETATEITDPAAWRARLSTAFGIELTAEEVAALGLF